MLKKILFFIQLITILIFVENCTPTHVDVSVIPKPVEVTTTSSSYVITQQTKVLIDNKNAELVNVAKYFTQLIQPATGFDLQVVDINNSNLSENVIIFTISDQVGDSEAYELNVTSEKIELSANSANGIFYGIQTIRQLLPPEIESTESVKEIKWEIHGVNIKDKPRFKWRGMQMDVSRHFFSVDDVKEFIDYLAMYKINTYHMHLTDDQGWRLEIKKYPKLTSQGAWRTHSNHDSTCIRLAEEDDSFKIPEKFYRTINGKTRYGGFYTQEEMKDIIKYAADRFITIVPEIDVPGHFKSATDNYPYLSCTEESGWGTNFSYPACLGKETTYEFIENILSEVSELFPSEYIHIGGDEVNIESWKECPLCQKEIRIHGLKNEHELQSHFNRRIEKFLESKGKKLMGWDEIVQGGLTENATVMWWRNWFPNAPQIAADAGSDVVISTNFELYFNGDYQFIPLKKVYNFDPLPKNFTDEQSKYIMGPHACLWAETIPSLKRLQFQTFPRITALSEIAWTPTRLKNWKDFKNRVSNEYEKWDVKNIFYHMPEITGLVDKWVFTDSAIVNLNIPLPDMEVRYSLDGSTPTKLSNLYSGPVTIKQACNFRVRAFRKHLFSEIFESEFEKQDYRESVDLFNPKSGIKQFYKKGRFERARDVDSTEYNSFSIVNEIGLGEHEDEEFFGLLFSGFIKIPETGIYTFYTSSDDGDVLFIGDRIVVDNDGSHATRRQSGMIALKEGFHPITVKFRQLGGGLALKAAIEGNGILERSIQQGDLYVK